ncbi:hypothetical protein V5799_025950, partial [Amblyomma americanum]
MKSQRCYLQQHHCSSDPTTRRRFPSPLGARLRERKSGAVEEDDLKARRNRKNSAFPWHREYNAAHGGVQPDWTGLPDARVPKATRALLEERAQKTEASSRAIPSSEQGACTSDADVKLGIVRRARLE